MANALFLSLLLTTIGPAHGAPADGAAFLQFSIHQRIVIRIPRMLGGRPGPRVEPAETRWIEKKAPKCVMMTTLEGAIISETDSVDLIVQDGTRLRARFDDKCPALDFYSGLYVKGTADGMICERRDSIRARSGSSCRIDRFKRLVARRK